MRVGGEEIREVVGSDGSWVDTDIETAVAPTALQHVPQGKASVGEDVQSFRIREVRAGADQLAQYFPEQVAWVRVILSGLKRCFARHAAEDERASGLLGDWWKTVDEFHGGARSVVRQARTTCGAGAGAGSGGAGAKMKQRAHILVVDDQSDNLLILEDVLAEHYEVHPATNGADALRYLEMGGAADLILLDVMMPGLDGFEVCRQLKASESMRSIPVMFLTSLDRPEDEERGFSLGAEDFIHKPVSPPVVLARVRTHLALSRANRALQRRNADLELLVAERTAEISEQARRLVSSKQELIAAQAATITAFCALAEARDNETGNHIRRTQHYVRILAEALRDHPRFRNQLDDDVIQQLFKSAPLHDVGKVATPDAILLKPGKLTADEWKIMKLHCEFGRNAILQAAHALGSGGETTFLHYAAEIAYGHHERWDGGGYPLGIAGDAIPMSARLMAVADVFDALISRRVYKPPFPYDQAIQMMLAERGRHFDPDVVDALEKVAGKFVEIATSFRDEPDDEVYENG